MTSSLLHFFRSQSGKLSVPECVSWRSVEVLQIVVAVPFAYLNTLINPHGNQGHEPKHRFSRDCLHGICCFQLSVPAVVLQNGLQSGHTDPCGNGGVRYFRQRGRGCGPHSSVSEYLCQRIRNRSLCQPTCRATCRYFHLSPCNIIRVQKGCQQFRKTRSLG